MANNSVTFLQDMGNWRRGDSAQFPEQICKTLIAAGAARPFETNQAHQDLPNLNALYKNKVSGKFVKK